MKTVCKFKSFRCIIFKYLNKVDVQNNILNTLREASHVGEKAIFPFSFPAPPPRAFSASNVSKKVFDGQISAN